MIEKYGKYPGIAGHYIAPLTNFFKAFDPNDLHLIVIKLNVHDVGRSFQNLCKRSPCR